MVENQFNVAKFMTISDSELILAEGGIAWVPVLGVLALEAYRHSDQIISGFQKGYKAGRR